MKIALIAAALMIASAAHSQEGFDLGAIEYGNSCVFCHGSDGKGGGPFAQYLTVKPPSLTTLSKSNDGVFPVTRVHAVIDGTADVALHGGREMPIWGRRYMSDMQNDVTAHYSEDEARRYASLRILSLIEFLGSIQEE